MTHRINILDGRPRTHLSIRVDLSTDPLNQWEPFAQEALPFMLPKRAESHAGGDKPHRRLIQERSSRVLPAPTGCAESEPERDRQMARSPLGLDLVAIGRKDRASSDLIRRNSDDLPPHLTAGQSRRSTQLRRLKRSIDIQRRGNVSGSPCAIGSFRCQGFSAAHAASQQIFDVPGKLIGCFDRAALNGGFQARRKCIPTRREKRINKPQPFKQCRRFHWMGRNKNSRPATFMHIHYRQPSGPCFSSEQEIPLRHGEHGSRLTSKPHPVGRHDVRLRIDLDLWEIVVQLEVPFFDIPAILDRGHALL